MNLIVNSITQETLRTDLPDFKAGDRITVFYKIKEGAKERIQQFQGDVLQRRNSGVNEMFTVRKISNGVGVERIFPLHSPYIDKIEEQGASRTPVAGEVPNPLNPPSGCTFHPRCPIARERCKEVAPLLSDDGGTQVACHAVSERWTP